MRKLPKSFSTQNLNKNKRAGSVASSSLKGTNTNFKFREPFFSPLNKISKETEDNCHKYLKKWSEQRTLSPPKRRSFHSSCIYKNETNESINSFTFLPRVHFEVPAERAL